MSRVYFTSPSDEAELSGAERAHFGRMVSDIGLMALGVDDQFGFDNEKIVAAVDGSRSFVSLRHPATSLRVNEDELFLRLPDGTRHKVWHLFLNAALAVGGEPLRLAARIHAQCEIHGWIDGADREWAAAVIEAGCASGLYRVGVGWDTVVPFLRSSSDEPVILSYSVCDHFPSRRLTDLGEDTWEAMSRAERWSAAWKRLRGMNDRRICENGVHFGSGVNAFQAHDAITGWTERVGRATPPASP